MNIINTLSGWAKPIKDALYNAYTGIMNYVGNPFSNLKTSLTGNVNHDKIALDNLRNKHFSDINIESTKSNPDFVRVAKNITKDTKQYIQKMINEEVKKLGKPPCDFSVITLGSMAREETGPITDLEVGFLIKNKTIETYRYFYQLAQNLSDRLFLLGEHPDIGGKGLRMDEADNAPPHLRFFARNATREQAQALLNQAIMDRDWDKIPYEGSRPYLATPEEFASYSQPQFTQNKQALEKQKHAQFDIEFKKALNDPKNKQLAKTANGRKQIENEVQFWINQMYRPFNPRELRTANDAGKNLGRNMALLHGNQALYNKFMTLRETHFTKKEANGKTMRQNLARNIMTDDTCKHIQKGESIFVTGKLGKTLDIKRELYRFVEEFATNLGFYHQCKSQNTFDIVQELKTKGILSPSLASKMQDFIQFSSGLRLKEQAVIKRQGFAAYFDQAEFDDDKKDLEDKIKQLQDTISYMEKAKQAPNEIATKKRALVKLQSDYHHMLEMAPGKIYSANDINALRRKYIPLGQEIFAAAKEWTQNKEKLGFTPVPATFTPAMKNALAYAQLPSKGFFPALNKLKQEQPGLNKEHLLDFMRQCQKQQLITSEDKIKLQEIKARRAVCAAAA